MIHDNIMYEPLDTSAPSETDLQQSSILESLLVEYNLYPTVEETNKRELVLSKLHEMARKFVKTVSLAKSFSEAQAEKCGCMLVTSGSFRLGVHGPDSDIDAVCIVPSHVSKEDFFRVFFEMLNSDPLVTELNAVPDAHVPVIKFLYDEVDIDLLFACLPLPRIDEEELNILDDSLMDHCDQATQRSLNGPRVANDMLQLVKNETNFRILLRCIKQWAKQRGIYGNALGFPGGIAWALMCAKICQWYPNAAPNVLLQRMFHIYSQWQWPNPITLKRKFQGSGLKIWDPQTYPADKYHLMPVITPAYPSMNSTYNISKTTLRVLTEEFYRGKEIADSAQTKADWEHLFEPSEFFVRYKNYMQVTVSAATEDEHRAWEGFVGSRLRFLIKGMEQVPNAQLTPYPKWFRVPDAPEPTSVYYIAVNFTKPQSTEIWKVIFENHTNEFSTQVTRYDARTEGQRNPKITRLKRSEIPTFVLPKPERKPYIRRNNESKKRKWRQIFDEDSTLPQHREVKRVKLDDNKEDGSPVEAVNGKITSQDGVDSNGGTPPTDANGTDEKKDENGSAKKPERKKPTFRTQVVEDEDDDEDMLGIPTRLRVAKAE